MIANLNLQVQGTKIDYRIQSEVEKDKVLNLNIGASVQTKSKNLNDTLTEYTDPKIRFLKRIGILEYKTCQNRKYKDILNEPWCFIQDASASISSSCCRCCLLSRKRAYCKGISKSKRKRI
ncbi:hypothetical protein [Anaerocellum danielii]|nr:hypothetical protein [Caldicellulosiruptor danielii]